MVNVPYYLVRGFGIVEIGPGLEQAVVVDTQSGFQRLPVFPDNGFKPFNFLPVCIKAFIVSHWFPPAQYESRLKRRLLMLCPA
jgi:hypothetical protein